MELTLIGVSKVRAKILKIANKNPLFAARALNEIAEFTMTDSLQLVPVKYGRLKGTGKVMPHATPQSLVARLNYSTNYAVWVHEVQARHYPPYGTGGQWKYLEDPVNRRAKTFAQDVAKIIRREIKASVG